MLDVYVNDDLEPSRVEQGMGTGGGMHVQTVVIVRLGQESHNDGELGTVGRD